jgi:integrase
MEKSTAALSLPARLDPAMLDERAHAALRELVAEGESKNTVASYRAALRYWEGWYGLRYGSPLELPMAPAAAMQFILDHAERVAEGERRLELPVEIDKALISLGCKKAVGALSMNTITHRLSVLSQLHTLRRQPNPMLDPAVRELLAKARRAHAKRGEIARGKPALTREPLERLLATCDDSLAGKRDHALLLFAWATGGRRRSEVTAATMDNVVPNDDGSYTYWLGATNTNPSGERRPEDAKPVVGRAAEALKAWLDAAQIREGAIFRRVRAGTTAAEPLQPQAVWAIVKRRVAMAGLDSALSAHSLRSGFLTEAGRRGVPLGEAMALSGHAAVQVAMGYYRVGAAGTAAAARLLDDERK